MASKISVTTLRQGAEMLGLDVGDLKKKKELEALIDEHLQQQVLGYECPECGKDIPDVDVCPYCGESFIEEEPEEVEDADSLKEPEEVEDADSLKEPEEVEDADSLKEHEEVEGDTAEVGVEEVEEIAEEVAEAVTKKIEEKEKSSKSKGKSKEKSGRGRPAGKSKSTEEKEKEFAVLIAKIDEVLGDGFEKRERKTGITYVKDRKRLIKAVTTGKTLSIEFNVELTTEDDNLKKYTADEAKARHLGSTRAIYTLGDIDFAIELVKEALNAK